MQKTEQLEALIQSWGKVIVGYSGGVDSTLVAFVANKVLGRNALIVLASTETITAEDVDLAQTIAKKHHFNFLEIAYSELEIKNYAENPVNRCYFCKQELYHQLGEIAKKENIPFILDGANLDDIGDYRPGRIAAKEYRVRSPLMEAQFTKQDVREAALVYGLPNHDKPSAPCLSSRIPYGTMIDRASLSMIAKAERFIKEQGFTNVRVRHFQTTAKIEVDASAVPKLTAMFHDVQSFLKSLGYKEVLIDEEGFQSGKLNREIVRNAK
ncbi:MAG: ATP-dependent sacrificial sulfur transferase LarE [Ignavibacteriae bacterium]|nr:MAG: ATP-dependent sacrificial sulfur transferase LarE [Ignavibacteriota bacterium]